MDSTTEKNIKSIKVFVNKIISPVSQSFRHKHVVDNVEKLHDSLIQMQIFQPLKQVGVLLTVRSEECQLLRFSFCWQDLYCCMNRL